MQLPATKHHKLKLSVTQIQSLDVERKWKWITKTIQHSSCCYCTVTPRGSMAERMAVDRSGWSVSRHSYVTPGNGPLYPTDRGFSTWWPTVRYVLLSEIKSPSSRTRSVTILTELSACYSSCLFAINLLKLSGYFVSPGSTFIIWTSAHWMPLCFPCGFRTTQRFLPYITSNDWFLWPTLRVFTARYEFGP